MCAGIDVRVDAQGDRRANAHLGSDDLQAFQLIGGFDVEAMHADFEGATHVFAAFADAEDVYIRAAQLPNLEVLGVDCHIGSQLTTLPPFIDALDRLLALVDRLGECGIYLHHIDLGGGVGVRYRDEEPPLIADYIQAVRERIEGRGLTLMFEPGRYIVANAGVLLTQVEYLKHTEHKDFAIVDAAMNDLIRPALYQAWMDVTAVKPRAGEVLVLGVLEVLDLGQQHARVGNDVAARLEHQGQAAAFSALAHGLDVVGDLRRFFIAITHTHATTQIDVLQVNAALAQAIGQRQQAVERIQERWRGCALSR